MSKETTYKIHVREILDPKWEAIFSPLQLIPLNHETIITGLVQDQAALFGILIKIRDLGLQLISVNTVPEQDRKAQQVETDFPILTSERLLLREFSLTDIPAVFDIFSRPEVVKWVEGDLFENMSRAETRVKERMDLFHKQRGCRWAIALRESPMDSIGSCGYFHVRKGSHTWEIGYDLHPAYWGQGLMSEALQTMIEFCLSTQNHVTIHRLEALVDPGNTASIRLLEKFGFDRECLRREFGLWNNRYQDVLLYALLNHNQPASNHSNS
ncbi:MAG TPA: GNAT family N-acetyltransferase [Anaerolineales bacterium]|nr:GNAT family N-acetyltransferase [Anaerolineales bacterium]